MDLWFEVAVVIMLILIWLTSRTTYNTQITIPDGVLKQIRDQLELIKDELREIRKGLNNG